MHDRKLPTLVTTDDGDVVTVYLNVEDTAIDDDDTIEISIPPDGGYGWVVVAASAFIMFTMDGIMFGFGLFLKDIADHFNLSFSIVTIACSMQFGMVLLPGPFYSALLNRIGSRGMVAMGGTFACVGFFISAWLSEFAYFCIFYGVIAGIGIGSLYLPALVHVGFYFEKKRALATGIASCGGGIGCIIMGPLISVLIEHYNWQGAQWILAGFWFQCIVAGVLMIPVTPTIVKNEHFDTESNTESNSDAPSEAVPNLIRQQSLRPHASPLNRSDLFYTGSIQMLSGGSIRTSRQSFVSLPKNVHVKSTPSLYTVENEKSGSAISSCIAMLDLELLKNPMMLLAILANAFCSLSIYIPFIYTTGMVRELGASSTSSGLLVTIVGLSTIISRLVYGWLADHVFTAISITAGSLFVCGMATALAGFLNNYYLVAIYMCIFGLTHGSYWSLSPVVIAECVGLEKLTNGVGLVFVIKGIFTLIGIPLGGALYEYSNSYVVLYLYAGTLLMLTGLTFFVINILHRRSEKSVLETEITRDY